ncbi:unnamed protein product [Rotaria socialis]|uniref:Peptidase M15C domain-containing protein n=1 Tax=Rotaria socialis TaxID=392032 RepID=A0A817SJL4_9BILA|nr:unnamed protein product [Rotaria socialis]CAF4643689.1 unnamed protein product [Rotaria socialis]
MKYGFGSFENLKELNANNDVINFGDYGMDLRLGRRENVDPLWKKYPYLSPYSVFGNDPINVIDENGRELVKLVIKTNSPYIMGQITVVVDKEISDKLKTLMQFAIDNKIYVHINSDFRTTQEQSTNIQKTGLTPASPGKSRHEGGFALDFQLYKNNSGKEKDIINKTDMAKQGGNAFIEEAKRLGFRWGGEFSKKDGVHIDAWPAGKQSMFGYESWEKAYNENQADYAKGTYETEIFTGHATTTKMDFGKMIISNSIESNKGTKGHTNAVIPTQTKHNK